VKKIAQNVAQTPFRSKLTQTSFFQVPPKVWLLLQLKNAQGKQSSHRKKSAQFGHPVGDRETWTK
jgi:hypothetical protein